MNHQQQKPKQVQVKQHSGNVINPNLDDASLLNLLEIQSYHKDRGNHFSQSVLVRRAVRLYRSMLMRGMDYERELVETKRAAKGVM